MKKAILLILLAALYALPALSQDFTYDGLNYTVLDADARTCTTKAGYVKIDTYIAGNNLSVSNLIIPGTVYYNDVPYTVTEIGKLGFYRNSALHSVTIPNSVTSIGNHAFYNCTNLTSVDITNSVTSIGSGAFSGCSGLTSVDIPNSVTSIGTGAFTDCTGLSSVDIPNSVTSIGDRAFYNCRSLTSLIIPNSVTSIGDDAFSGCTNISYIVNDSKVQLSSAKFRNSNIKKIAQRAGTLLPSGFSADITVVYPDDNILITDDGFVFSSDRSKIYVAPPSLNGTYTVPAGTKEIMDNAFALCNGITIVESNLSPAPVISASAFTGLYDTTALKIPAEIIGDYVNDNSNWTLFQSLNVVDPYSMAETFVADGLKYRYVSDTEAEVIASDSYKNLSSIVIPATVTLPVSDDPNETQFKDVTITGIAEMAFAECESLVEIEIPSTVTRIGDGAFRHCSALAAIALPSGVTRIGGATFEGCSSLTAVAGLDNIISIGSSAFAGTILSQLNLPNISVISDYAFSGVNTLASLSIGGKISSIGIFAFRGAKLTAVDLKSTEGVAVGDGAFIDNAALTSVTLGEGVKSVGDYAFNSCGKLKTVTLPESLERIGKAAFAGDVISTLTLPKTAALTEIGDSAFIGIRVRSLDLPDALKRIGDDAFSDARMVTKITMPANNELTIGNRAFLRNQRLAEVEFPDVIASIGDSCFVDNVFTALDIKADYIGQQAFINSPKLATLSVSGARQIGKDAFRELPELVSAVFDIDTIGQYAFYNVPKLEEVTFHDGVKVIDEYSFNNCKVLKNAHFGLGLEAIKNRALYNTAVDSISFPSAQEPDPKIVFSAYAVDTNKCRYLSLGNRAKSISISLADNLEYLDLGTSVKTLSLTISESANFSKVTLPTSVTTLGGSIVADTILIPEAAETLWINSSYNTSVVLYGKNLLYINRPIDRPDIYTAVDHRPSTNSIFDYRSNLVFGDNKNAENALCYNMINRTGSSSYKYLNSLHVGAAVKSIVADSEGGNVRVDNITFDEGIESISGLTIGKTQTTLKLPASLKSLGGITAPGLTEIVLSDSKEPLTITVSTFSSPLTSLYIGRDIEGTSFTMAGAAKLTHVIVGDSVTTINDNMFKNCAALTNVVMGDNVKHIGAEAFRDCAALDILSLGESIETIGTDAYAGCTGFSRIVTRGLTPPEGMAGFGREVEDNVPLYVPEEAFDDYFDSDLFYPFYTIETHADGKIVESVEVEPEEGSVDPEFTVGSTVRIPGWLRFIFHIVGEVTGHKAPMAVRAKAPEAATPAIRWFSPNPDVATVDQEGNVTIMREGEFEIWAYALDGSDKKAVITMGNKAAGDTVAGDFNADGSIDVLDLQMLVKHILTPGASSIIDKNADINSDGSTDAIDLQHHINIILNK